MTGHALGAAIAVMVLAGIAVIALGVAHGGGWRVAGTAVTAVGVAALVAPGMAKTQVDNNFEEVK